MSASRPVKANPSPPEREERTATGLMAFAVISSCVVVLVIVAFIAAALSFARTNVTSPVAGPYDTLNRPAPDARVDTPEALFPPQLGRFQRETLTGSLDDFQAAYSNGADRISIQGSRAVSYAAAQRGVIRVEDELGPANVAQRISTGETHYSYYLSQTQGGVRYAWSRQEWFFDIQASSRQALDDFMDSFQY